jgi:hypothetical protein
MSDGDVDPAVDQIHGRVQSLAIALYDLDDAVVLCRESQLALAG